MYIPLLMSVPSKITLKAECPHVKCFEPELECSRRENVFFLFAVLRLLRIFALLHVHEMAA